MEHTRPTLLDLFAGAGGLSLGLEEAGFEAVAAVELDADAAETYRRWHGRQGRLAAGRREPKMHESDLANVDLSQYRGQIDLVAGGPPCQPWSLGGLRRGHADPRDGLLLYIEALKAVQPRAFIMENVAGLSRGATRDDFLAVVDSLRSMGGWQVDWAVLQAADFGVPQKRERLFVVGVPAEAEWKWPRPSFGPGRSRPWRTAGEALLSVSRKTSNRSIVTYAKYPTIRPNPYHGQVFNGGGRPIDLDAPAPTLLASMGGNKTPWVDELGIVPQYHHRLRAGGAPRSGTVKGARRISFEEAAALQTFPSEMELAGTVSSRYRQIGNAVPPTLAAAIGRAVMRSLSDR